MLVRISLNGRIMMFDNVKHMRRVFFRTCYVYVMKQTFHVKPSLNTHYYYLINSPLTFPNTPNMNKKEYAFGNFKEKLIK